MAEAPILIFHKKYTDSLEKLPVDVQNQYSIATMQFMMNPNHPGLNVKPWKWDSPTGCACHGIGAKLLLHI